MLSERSRCVWSFLGVPEFPQDEKGGLEYPTLHVCKVLIGRLCENSRRAKEELHSSRTFVCILHEIIGDVSV